MHEESSVHVVGTDYDHPCHPGGCWSRPSYFLNNLVYTYYPVRVFDGDGVMTDAHKYAKLISNHTYRHKALMAGFPPPGPNLFEKFAFWFLGGTTKNECVNIVSPIHCVASVWAMAM